MKKSYLISLLALLCACGGPSAKEAAFTKEALGHHEAAMAAEKQVKELMAELGKLKPALASLKDSLAADPDRLAKATQALETMDKAEADFAAWAKTIVEVPGHEHQHEHGQGHDHDHTPVQATPEQMVAIQREIKDNAVRIKDLATSAVAMANQALNQ
jgi:hypothetical protein